jgi:hypothetical protein
MGGEGGVGYYLLKMVGISRQHLPYTGGQETFFCQDLKYQEQFLRCDGQMRSDVSFDTRLEKRGLRGNLRSSPVLNSPQIDPRSFKIDISKGPFT